MIKLLMIDDNPLEHIIMQKMLAKFNLFPGGSYRTDAREIIKSFQLHYKDTDQLPDVIFLDLNMPGFNGWDFLEAFRILYPKIKKAIDIYIVSSTIDPVDMQLAKQYDFVKASLCKPVKMETLLNLHSLYQHSSRFAS